jgi:ATP-dependent protease HslVU (ClpYQ) peptidase subunit
MVQGGQKYVVTRDKVYAVSGTLVTGLRFIEWLKGDREKTGPRLKDTVVVEFDRKTGQAQMWESRHVPLPCKDVYVTGSGGQIALGALAAGADEKEAIQIASKYDAYTGNGVKVWRKE